MAELLQGVPGQRIDAPYASGKPLNGIMSQLKALCGRNLHESGQVKVLVSSAWDEGYHARSHLIDVNDESITATKDIPDSWIGYDAGENVRIMPLSYTLRARTDYSGHPNSPHSWIIETSVDGSNWMTIDWRVNVNEIKGNLAIVHFEMKRAAPPCRYIRLVQIDKNGQGNNILTLSAFEIFGTCYVI